MTDSETKFISYPFDTSRVKVSVAVKIEGDIFAEFKASVEEQFTKHWANITRAIESRNAWDLKNTKLHFNKYLRLNLLNWDYTEAEFEELALDDWMHIYKRIIMVWAEEYWGPRNKNYGSFTNYAIREYILNYLETPEARARLEEWIGEEWLMDLLMQKGINASRKAKLPSEGNLAV